MLILATSMKICRENPDVVKNLTKISGAIFTFYCYQKRSHRLKWYQNVSPSVCTHVSASTRRIYLKFYIGDFCEIC
jgi:hypothetical protein